MAGRIDARLLELGITLPVPSAPRANYVPWVRVGDLLFIAGQVTFEDGKLVWIGKVGEHFTVEEGQLAARLVALNVLAQVRAALDGDLDRVVRVVRLGGFVNCPPEFIDHPKVMNGASDLLVDVFGEAGRHARTAVGSTSLPFDVAVEADAIFEVR